MPKHAVKFILLLVLILISSFVVGGSVRAETLVIQPGPSESEDTRIGIRFPSSPDPTFNYLPAIGSGSGDPNNQRALLKFDLSDLPEGVVIDSAELSWTYRSVSIPSGRYIYVHRITSDWTDDWATWTNMHENFDPTPITSFGSGVTAVDITSLVSDWYSGDTNNYGVTIKSEEAGVHYGITIWSSEYGTSSARPKLTITYHENTPPNTPTNSSPVGDATDVNLNPTLESSGFSDPDSGDTHQASDWRVTTTSGDYSSIVFSSYNDVDNLTSIDIEDGVLSVDETYYWQVRHQDNNGAWSAWSSETSFTTTSDVDAPTVISVSVSPNMINEDDDGDDFTITINFSETMNTGVDPDIDFEQDGSSITIDDLTLNDTSSEWIDNDTYKAAYNISDDDSDFTDVDLEITTAQDLVPLVMDTHSEPNEFSIDMVAPSVSITSSHSEIYNFRDWFEVTWSVSPIDGDSFDLELCTDDASPICSAIASGLSGTSHSWFVPNASGSYKIKITATDDGDNTATDESGVFSIAGSSECGNHNVYGWGWNPYIGWISLNCDQDEGTGVSATVDYGVEVADGGTAVSGYAWSGWGETGYWICFGGSCGGDYVSPPSGAPSGSYNGTENEINGWAKFLGWGDDGWIKLDGTADGTDYAMNMSHYEETGPDPFDYYVVRGYIDGSLEMSVDSYSWNNKIGWIRWYSVCADTEENESGVVVGDGYGAPLAGWGLSTDLDSDDRDKCGGDCIDTEADCDAFVADITDTAIPENSYYDNGSFSIGVGENLGDLVASYCKDIRGNINPGETESGNDECSDLLDNDCDGLIDCEESDCAGSPTGPTGFDGEDDECGFIKLTWQESVGTTGGSSYCSGGGAGPMIDEFVIYRAVYDGSSCSSMSESDFINEVGTEPYNSDISVTTYEYDDYSVIPRVEYCYRVTRRQMIEVDDGSGGTITEEEETEAATSGPFETVCYPGSEWEED